MAEQDKRLEALARRICPMLSRHGQGRQNTFLPSSFRVESK
jgi:hypothetical protein